VQLDWLLSPVTFYSGAALCLITSLGLFVNMKLEMARMRTAAIAPPPVDDVEDPAVAGMKAEIERLRESVSRLEEVRPSQPAGPGINLTKRAQVLRMHRRGEAASSIAAAMEMPPNEVALLLKVHTMTSPGEMKAS
jgi:hypothetical protein